MDEAEDRIFGFVVMNDWSARDIQKWEYVPLGPFGAKNWATTISPWVVTPMALEPFKCKTSAGEQVDPTPLPYLIDKNYGSYDIKLGVDIQGDGMAKPEVIQIHVVIQHNTTQNNTTQHNTTLTLASPRLAQRVVTSNFANLYWNVKQQLVHHSVTGCNMRAGDLLGSGTISGQTEDSFGSMLEQCWKGTKEVKLGESGQIRKFLKDGDVVNMTGTCETEGFGKVGFGNCMAKVLPAGSKLKAGAGNGTWVEA